MITFRENEKIFLIKRRHKVVLFLELLPLKAFFLLLIASAIALLASPPFSFPEFMVGFFPEISIINLRVLLFLFLSLLLLIYWVVFFAIITDYYLDCWIVTNERTIHTELKGFFHRVISTVHHRRIQDITVKVEGFLPTFFRYGNLKIQTAGGFRAFIFQQIPEPYQTKDIIFKAQKELILKERGLESEEF